MLSTERVGFEPTEDLHPRLGFQDQCHKPLDHLSLLSNYTILLLKSQSISSNKNCMVFLGLYKQREFGAAPLCCNAELNKAPLLGINGIFLYLPFSNSQIKSPPCSLFQSESTKIKKDQSLPLSLLSLS